MVIGNACCSAHQVSVGRYRLKPITTGLQSQVNRLNASAFGTPSGVNGSPCGISRRVLYRQTHRTQHVHQHVRTTTVRISGRYAGACCSVADHRASVRITSPPSSEESILRGTPGNVQGVIRKRFFLFAINRATRLNTLLDQRFLSVLVMSRYLGASQPQLAVLPAIRRGFHGFLPLYGRR